MDGTIKSAAPRCADRGAAKGTGTIHIDYSTSIQKCKEKYMYYYNGAGQRFLLPEQELEPPDAKMNYREHIGDDENGSEEAE